MPAENLKPIDLKIDPKDPWTVIPADRRQQLQKDLSMIAEIRRTAFVESAKKPLP